MAEVLALIRGVSLARILEGHVVVVVVVVVAAATSY